jgi:hypothetical protein
MELVRSSSVSSWGLEAIPGHPRNPHQYRRVTAVGGAFLGNMHAYFTMHAQAARHFTNGIPPHSSSTVKRERLFGSRHRCELMLCRDPGNCPSEQTGMPLKKEFDDNDFRAMHFLGSVNEINLSTASDPVLW